MCFKWIEKKIKNLKWYDISLIKLSTAAFILFIAKLWSGLLYLNWYWYLIIGILAAIMPCYRLFTK
ncbi:hypothetical protein HOK51_02320 [Candidatus Woesearchaeota archaeon]|jgi:hypothetical protein|nr:hypothetical protein [Candidatus Woesearchaeota archaeon]MBT6518652.1 hypothetical protein [Candidatus Woesearchaeota archaeon]MBT7368842.1 hypothetical protein [Candidatus Woesearchaeota archaeon]